MSDVAITAEGLGKRYRISDGPKQRYTALRDVLSEHAWRFGQSALGIRGQPVEKSPENVGFWALEDVSFELRRGEVLGIIGGNGAGKSTLLKILSRVTEPTRGRARIAGRVASLLEAGTGFHPELTGRENIFLNGAILGMSRAEIRARFDAIVAFAGTERFLDVPVKRYSSGMFMRLAFAVAAHLESEIFVLDEVLAVGDAEFQKRCVGKLTEAAKDGRTVLFVSHNMAAVKSLTTSALVLDRGRMRFRGNTDEAIEIYNRRINDDTSKQTGRLGRGEHTAIRRVQLLNASGEPAERYLAGEPFGLRVTFETDGTRGLSLEVFLLDQYGANIAFFSDHAFHGLSLPDSPGLYECDVLFDPLWLASGEYSIDIFTAEPNVTVDHRVRRAMVFEVAYSNPGGGSWDFAQSSGFGCVALTRRSATSFERKAE